MGAPPLRCLWGGDLASLPCSPPCPTGFPTLLPTGFPTVPHGVPHSPPHGAPHCAPRGSPLSSPRGSPPFPTGFPTLFPVARGGGNCINRDATRRRHAVAMFLMVQNPHPPRALPTVPHGVPHRAPRGSPPCPTGFPTLLPTALHGWGSCARARPGLVDNPRNIKEISHVCSPGLTPAGCEWPSSHADCVLDFLHFSPRQFFVGNMPKMP